MAKRVRDSATIRYEIDDVTKQIKDVEAQVRKAEAAVEKATQIRGAVRAKLCEIAEKLKRPHLGEQERVALVEEQQSCVVDLTAAEQDLERLSRKEEHLHKKEEHLRKEKEHLRKQEEHLRKQEEYLRKEKEQQDGLDVESAAGAGAATQSTAPLLDPHGDGSLLWVLFGHFAEAAHHHDGGRQEHVRGALQTPSSHQHQD